MATNIKSGIPPATVWIPGVRGIPFVTRVAEILKLNGQPIDYLQRQYQRFGRLSGVTAFPNNKSGLLVAFGEAANQTVLSDSALFYSIEASEMGGDSPLVRLASGLVNMNGDRHRKQRRLMMPAFHKGRILDYQQTMIDHTNTMLDEWSKRDTIDLMPEIRRLVLRIVSDTLFGVDDVDSDQMGTRLHEFVKRANAPQNLFLPPLRRKLDRFAQSIETDLHALIERKRAAPGNDVLSTLIQSHDEDGASLTDAELIGHLAVLFIAGYETTVNVVAWTLILLANHPSIRGALVEELSGVLHGESPTAETVGKLTLLDAVIKESMRLLPPVIYTVRRSTEPFTLENIAFPKDTMIFLSHFITHRLPDVFSEPSRFLPERWSSIDPSPYAYMPFSAGARMCIGASFASLEMRIILGMLLQRYTVIPSAPVDYATISTLMQPKGAVPCRLHPVGAHTGKIAFSDRLKAIIA